MASSIRSQILLSTFVALGMSSALAEQATYNGREVPVGGCSFSLPAGQCNVPVRVEGGVAYWVPSSGMCAVMPCSEAPSLPSNVRIL